jgi:hypothetical protein
MCFCYQLVLVCRPLCVRIVIDDQKVYILINLFFWNAHLKFSLWLFARLILIKGVLNFIFTLTSKLGHLTHDMRCSPVLGSWVDFALFNYALLILIHQFGMLEVFHNFIISLSEIGLTLIRWSDIHQVRVSLKVHSLLSNPWRHVLVILLITRHGF